MPRKPSPPRLEKNPYGYWEIRWPEGGQRRDASTGTKDMNEARIMLAHFIVAREQKQKEKAAPKSAAPTTGAPAKCCATWSPRICSSTG